MILSWLQSLISAGRPYLHERFKFFGRTSKQIEMKKRSAEAVLLVLILGLFVPLADATESKAYTWQDKLKRGALNIVSSPVEVARDIHVTTQEKNLLVGWTVGLVKGLGEGFIRMGVGVIDLVTFPFNFPEGKKASLIDPEYVWEKPGPKYI